MKFQELNNYDSWANKVILEALALYPRDSKTDELFHHVLSASELWYWRLIGDPRPWNENDNPVLFSSRVVDISQKLNCFIDRQTSTMLEELFSFKTLIGEVKQAKRQDVLHHVFNHATHHRAQILMRWSEINIPRPSIDYIYYILNYA
jgi:uncharacterized damage-inducible protein DinB